MRSRDDSGNLLLLAGIVITIAFVSTALTLSEVASLERQASTESSTSLAAEWRFIRDRLDANLNTSIAVDTEASTYTSVILPSIASAFRTVESEKGFDLVIRPATTTALYGASEASMLNPPNTGVIYGATPYKGSAFTFAKDSDQTDGIIWHSPCDDPSIVGACIQGVVVYVKLSDGTAALNEVILYRVNTP